MLPLYKIEKLLKLLDFLADIVLAVVYSGHSFYTRSIIMMKERENNKTLLTDAAGRRAGEKRSGTDRRKNHKKRLKYLLFKGRRESVRRDEDRERIIIFDRYTPKLFATITVILILSIFDALFTLILIENGSSELNPVMAYFLQHGILPFIVAKYFLTSIGVVILLILKNVFLTRARIYAQSLFSAVIVTFLAVIAWEIYLLLRLN